MQIAQYILSTLGLIQVNSMIEKADYWFLNLANSYPAYLGIITPCDHFPVLKTDIDHRTPGLSTREIIKSLRRLFQQGFLLAIKYSLYEALVKSLGEPMLEDLIPFGFIPSEEEMQRELIQQEPVTYDLEKGDPEALSFFLTPQGGKLWEFIFQPKWSKYVTRCGDSITHKIYCADSNTGKKLIEIDNLLCYNENYIRCLTPGTEIWETFTPWKVNYWKTLPVGYSVSYQTENILVNKSQKLIEERKKAHDCLMDIWYWYNRNYYGDNHVL